MRKSIVPFIVGASASVAILKCLEWRKTSQTNSQPDLKFIKNAILAGAAEIAFGELAMEQAVSNKVKSFAKMLVTDHQKVNDQLTQILKKKDFKGNANFELSADVRRNLKKMGELSDTAFEKSFVQSLEENHKKVIKVFNQQADKGTDTELKNWAIKTLPMLEKHLEHARGLLET